MNPVIEHSMGDDKMSAHIVEAEGTNHRGKNCFETCFSSLKRTYR